MFEFIDILRGIAAILITNSHYSDIWPISQLATGGAFGNVIFFFVSGYCSSNVKEQFPIWYKKKILRIYPKTIFVAGCTYLVLLVQNKIEFSMRKIIFNVFYPIEYWFVIAILWLFLIFYLIQANKKKFNTYLVAMVLSLILYSVLYVLVVDLSSITIEGSSSFKWIIYFMCLITGAKIRDSIEYIKNRATMKNYLIVGISSFFSFYIFSLLASKYVFLCKIQFVLHIAMFLFGISIMGIGIFYEDWLKRKKNSPVLRGLKYIGKYTLEIYLIQVPLLKYFEFCVFPINIIVASCGILVLAKILSGVFEITERKKRNA